MFKKFSFYLILPIFLLGLVFSPYFAGKAKAEVVIDNVFVSAVFPSQLGAGSGPISIEDNPNRALLVFFGANAEVDFIEDDETGATWHHIGSAVGNNGFRGEVWIGVNPDVGEDVGFGLEFTGLSSSAGAIITYSLYGVDQNNPVESFVSATSGSLVVSNVSGNTAFSSQFDLFDTRNVSGCTTTKDVSAFPASGAASAHCTNSPTATFNWNAFHGSGSIALGASVVAHVDTPPTLSLSADPLTITLGASSTLEWSTTNADECEASGAWEGVKATSSSEIVSPLATSTYTLTCTGAGGEVEASTTINVLIPPPPTPDQPTTQSSIQTTTSLSSRITNLINNGDYNTARNLIQQQIAILMYQLINLLQQEITKHTN